MNVSVVMGMDLGFRKTGTTVFNVSEAGSYKLMAADTLTYDPIKGLSVMAQDLSDSQTMYTMLTDKITAYEPRNICVEVPHGGGQSARALRCMSLITGVLASIMTENPSIRFHLFSPGTVEKALGIHLGRNEAKAKGLTKGKLGAWKKQRIKDYVLREFSYFKGWPETKALAEDAYDSAAAFLCGIKGGTL